jgi:transcription antitermination factor NusG
MTSPRRTKLVTTNAYPPIGALTGKENIAHPLGWAEQHWYAAYTCSHHEKRVAEQLAERNVTNFLPLYSSVRRWKDRRVRLTLPLFPGYVFVRLALQDRLRVLEIPSLVRLVGFGGSPSALPEEEVELLRSGLADEVHAEPHPFLTLGRRVRIVRGPFANFEGILQRKKNNFRLILSVELIQRSFAVNVDAADVQPVEASDSSRRFMRAKS